VVSWSRRLRQRLVGLPQWVTALMHMEIKWNEKQTQRPTWTSTLLKSTKWSSVNMPVPISWSGSLRSSLQWVGRAELQSKLQWTKAKGCNDWFSNLMHDPAKYEKTDLSWSRNFFTFFLVRIGLNNKNLTVEDETNLVMKRPVKCRSYCGSLLN